MSTGQLQLAIVGVGPGHPDLVTPQALAAIRSAELVVGWDLDLQPVRPWLKGKRVFLQTVKNYRRVMSHVARLARRSHERVAVPRVGDPCISSGLKGLLELFNGFEVSIIPGISSVQMLAALARINLDEAMIVTFHDYGDPEQKQQELVNAFCQGRHLVVLASPDLKPGPMARFLIEQGIPGRTRVVIGSNLTLPEERILRSTLAKIDHQEFHWLTITAVLNPSVQTDTVDRKMWLRWRHHHARKSADDLDS